MEEIAVGGLKSLLTEQGIGWVVAVLLAVVLYFMWREIKARDSAIERANHARLDEALKFVASREEHARALQANAMALEGNNRAMEARTRATEAVERTLADLALRTDTHNDRLMDKMGELRHKTDEGVGLVRDLLRETGGRK